MGFNSECRIHNHRTFPSISCDPLVISYPVFSGSLQFSHGQPSIRARIAVYILSRTASSLVTLLGCSTAHLNLFTGHPSTPTLLSSSRWASRAASIGFARHGNTKTNRVCWYYLHIFPSNRTFGSSRSLCLIRHYGLDSHRIVDAVS